MQSVTLQELEVATPQTAERINELLQLLLYYDRLSQNKLSIVTELLGILTCDSRDFETWWVGYKAALSAKAEMARAHFMVRK